MKSTWLSILLGLAALPAAARAQTIDWTRPIANVAGRHANDELTSATNPNQNGRSDLYDLYNMWGTDLGFPAVTGRGISLAFGDSFKNTDGAAIGTAARNQADDFTGWLSTTSPGWSTTNTSGGFPDGASVDRWVAAHGGEFWDTPFPTLQVARDNVGGTLHVRQTKVYALSADGLSVANAPGYTFVPDGSLNRYATGLGTTPSAAFGTPSNGEHRHWATFARHDAAYATASQACGTGYTVDTDMGTCGGVWENDFDDPRVDAFGNKVLSLRGIPCVGISTGVFDTGGNGRCDLEYRCLKPLARGSASTRITGLCLDTTSSTYDGSSTTDPRTASVDSRIRSIVLRQLVGYMDFSTQAYLTQPFFTNKFLNPVTATVQDFSPTRAVSSGSNNFDRATTSSANNRVFIWGRPGYTGFGQNGTSDLPASRRSNKLYFAYVDLPSAAAFTAAKWRMNYFIGYSNSSTCTTILSGNTIGTYPCFGTNPSRARALNLNGGSTDQTFESMDILNQMSVAWIPQLGKFMMLYAGDLPNSARAMDGGLNWPRMRRNPNGSIMARFAEKPWGPWSAPQEVEPTGNVVGDLFVTSATGGIFAGTDVEGGRNSMGYTMNTSNTSTTGTCNPTQVSCLQSEGTFAPYVNADKIGRLYGAAIVPNWTKSSGSNVQVYWLASTWNPYQVVLMKTQVRP